MKTKMLGMILAGGKGTRLGKLTQDQAKRLFLLEAAIESLILLKFWRSRCWHYYSISAIDLNNHIGNGASWGLDRLNSSATIL